MIRALVATIAFALAGGCVAQPRVVRGDDDASRGIHRFLLGEVFEYVVDANLRNCYFGHVDRGSSLQPVDCSELKRAVPATANVITWADEGKTGRGDSREDEHATQPPAQTPGAP